MHWSPQQPNGGLTSSSSPITTRCAALDYQARLARQGAALRIIVCEERTLDDRSHVIGLFLHKPLFGDTLPVVCEEIAAQEGIRVIPHPYRVISGALREHGPEPRKACFEIFNPRCSQEEIAGAIARTTRRFPRGLRPVAAKVFRFMLNRLGGNQSELEVKHAGSNFEK
jgi:hypothetical protein